MFICRVLAFFVFPIGTSIRNRLATFPNDVVGGRRNNRSLAISRGFSVTGLVCRNVSSAVGVLQISSVEILFLIKGGAFNIVFIMVYIKKMLYTEWNRVGIKD